MEFAASLLETPILFHCFTENQIRSGLGSSSLMTPKRLTHFVFMLGSHPWIVIAWHFFQTTMDSQATYWFHLNWDELFVERILQLCPRQNWKRAPTGLYSILKVRMYRF